MSITDQKLIELWTAEHLTNDEFFYLVDAVRIKQQLTITEVTNATFTISDKPNHSSSSGGIFSGIE